MDNKSMLVQTNMLLFFLREGRDAVFLGGELVSF